MDSYGLLLENPRKRRRRKASGRRRKASGRRRRSRRAVTVAVAANPRRRSRRRRNPFGRRRRAGRRRNPFGGMTSGLAPTFKRAIGLTLGEVMGDALSRVVSKFTPFGKSAMQAAGVRIAVGLFGSPLLRMLKVPAGIRSDFGAVNVASGIIGLTGALRQQVFSKVGLADYELADYELADYELAGGPPAGVLGTPPAGMFGGDHEDTDLDLLGQSDDDSDAYGYSQ